MTTIEKRFKYVLCFCTFNGLLQVTNCASINIPSPGFYNHRIVYTYVKYPTLSYTDAAVVCEKQYQGRLVTAFSVKKEAQLVPVMTSLKITDDFWIGMRYFWTGSHHVLAWNEDTCTEEKDVTRFHSDYSMNFDSSQECYKTDGNKPPQWERDSCSSHKTFMCEKTEVQFAEVNATFKAIFTSNSDPLSCQSICSNLKDCFLTSIANDACVVGIATNTTGAYIYETQYRIELVNNPNASYFNPILSKFGSSPPNPCSNDNSNMIVVTNKTIQEYDLSGNLCVPVLPSPCSCTNRDSGGAVVSSEVNVPQNTTTILPGERLVMMENGVGITPSKDVTTVMADEVTPCMQRTNLVTLEGAHATANVVEKTVTHRLTLTAACSDTLTQAVVMDLINITVATQEIVDKLKVDPTTLTQRIRSKSSAHNKVISAVVLGSTFTLICACFVGAVILSDAFKIISDVKKLLYRNIKDRVQLVFEGCHKDEGNSIVVLDSANYTT